MCGISGIVGPGQEDRALVRRMMDRVAHRGPDDSDAYIDGGCALGHTRLAIIDRAGGHEPIFDADGRRAIIYNGEIYNHEALRHELESRGVRFKTRSDAEVPLHLLAHAGDPGAALRRLEGMFSFVVWDTTTGRLLAARDPYGIKPFFWTRVDGAFLFASEMKALLAHPDVPALLDPDAVREKGVFEYLLGGTWLEGINELPPGHFLVTDGSDVRIERYHEERPRAVPSDPAAMARELVALLEASVRSQLMSEVPLGVILSGGLDSSLIAALNRRLDPERRIQTFSIAENEANTDLQKARLVADALGTDHRESFFTREDLDRDLAQVVWSIEDIDHETYFFYPLFRHMRPHATVALCGQGADEVFAGYPRYKDIGAHRDKIRARTASAFAAEPDRHDAVLETDMRDLRSFLAFDRGAQLADYQLRLVDRNSMAFSAEIRVPFLDTRVVSFGLGLPDSLLLDPAGVEKKALRLAARHTPLPPEIIDRPKVPAGRSTGRGVIESFERDVDRAYPDARFDAHPHRSAFRNKTELLMLDLFTEIFIHNRGAKPATLHWNDLL